MTRVAKTMIVGIVASLAILFVGAALVYSSVMGGLDDLFTGDRPQESDARVVAARDAAAAELSSSGDELASTAVAVTGGSPIGWADVTPACSVGQHNWKIDDPYDLSCDRGAIEVVAVGSRTDFRSQMVALDTALAADGWRPSGTFGMRRVLEEYWDHRDGLGTGYDVDNLPAASYQGGDGAQVWRLDVRWALADSQEIALSYEPATEFHEGASVSSAKDLLRAIPTGGYAVVLTESVTYFEE